VILHPRQWVLGVKWLEHEADHSSSSTPEVRQGALPQWHCTYVFHTERTGKISTSYFQYDI